MLEGANRRAFRALFAPKLKPEGIISDVAGLNLFVFSGMSTGLASCPLSVPCICLNTLNWVKTVGP